MNNTVKSEEEIANSMAKNYETMTEEKVPNTEFYIRWSEELGYFVTLGHFRVSDFFKTREEALAKTNVCWETILMVCTAITENALRNTNN